MTRLWIGVAVVAAGCVTTTYAQQAPQPQTRCLPMAVVKESLKTRFGEQPLWIGKTQDGNALMIFANPDETTWTALRFDNGNLCPIGAGDGWALRALLSGSPA